MDFFEAVQKRYSYRGKFKDIPVPQEDLEKILDAGLRAPSGYNKQSTTYVVVTDPALRDAIAKLQPMPAIATAPVLIIPLSEEVETHENLTFELEDYAASVENIMLAITAMGYAGVWTDGMMKLHGTGKAVAELLHVPAGKTVRAVIPVGVPETEGTQKEKMTIAQRVHWNAFDAE